MPGHLCALSPEPGTVQSRALGPPWHIVGIWKAPGWNRTGSQQVQDAKQTQKLLGVEPAEEPKFHVALTMPRFVTADLPSAKLWENSDQIINSIRVGRQEGNLIRACDG